MTLAKRFMYISLISALIFVASPRVSAQEMIDLKGIWIAEAPKMVYRIGAVELGIIITAITIDKQNGAFFRGSETWQMKEEGEVKSDIGIKQLHGGTEDFIGLIGFDGEEITIAEGQDSGYYRGRLIDNDHMILTYIESDLGDAVLFRAVFARQP